MTRSTSQHFTGKLVFITGGTSGIGLALGEELLRRNAKVVLAAKKGATIEATLVQLGSDHGLHGYVCDIGDFENVNMVARQVIAAHGVPDVLINNAGYATYRTFEQEYPEEIEQLMNVNFAGAVRVTKAFLPGMVARRSGHIVNMASIAGAISMTPNAVYSASKHGMVGWSKCIAIELARFGIDVTVICPGRVETNFFAHESFTQRKHRKETEMTIPMERVVRDTLDAIARRKKIRFIPRYYGTLAWAIHALGPLVQRPLDRLLRARINDLYPHKDRG
jgi:short-subunit dehydrogenase